MGQCPGSSALAPYSEPMTAKADTPDSPYRRPRLAKIVHRALGPLVATVFALKDAAGAAKDEFKRSYRAIRSWHADS